MLQLLNTGGLAIDVQELIVCPSLTSTVTPGAQQYTTVNTVNEFPADRSFLFRPPGELVDWGQQVTPWMTCGVGAYFDSQTQVVFDWYTAHRATYSAVTLDGALVVAVRLKNKPRLIEHVVLGSTPPVSLANQFDPARTWLFPCGASQTTAYQGRFARLVEPDLVRVFKGDGVTEMTSLDAYDAKQRFYLVQP